MSEERREFTRINHPIEGTWRGASGASPCRISDISPKGCFIQSLAAPVVGDVTTLVINHDTPVEVRGRVAYTEPGMGFAVEFVDLDDAARESLDHLIAVVTA